ncbi:unnamed protein product [Blepharisma stoltei]|uniref:Ribosomal protein L32 n=1 Tax=Blepharisma stoltei TaxID=1481888 RepID=A0AAU9IR42_9CILI|nr:unnamed protein product [Blepharisma stoltei]
MEKKEQKTKLKLCSTKLTLNLIEWIKLYRFTITLSVLQQFNRIIFFHKSLKIILVIFYFHYVFRKKNS